MNANVTFNRGPRRVIRNIYCVGRNYVQHVRELGNPIPTEPLFFQKSVSCLSSRPIITLPPGREIHYELEVVLFIGQGGNPVPAGRAWDHVAGMALGLDLTDRSLQSRFKKKGQPWFLAKSFRDAAVVTKFHHPGKKFWSREFWLRINDQTVQKGILEGMLFPIPTLIEYLSDRVPLVEGDLIYTGTPEGVGILYSGDRLELGLGSDVLGRFRVE